jgi:hypothetical protein
MLEPYVIADSEVKTTVSLHTSYSLVVESGGSITISGSDIHMYQAYKANIGV